MDYEKQANDFLRRTRVRLSSQLLGVTTNKSFKSGVGVNYDFMITIEKFSYPTEKTEFFDRFTFTNSVVNGTKPPTNYDILACLTKYDVGTLWDFIEEFGYTASKETEKIYHAVVKEFEMVKKFWNSEEIEELQEIQ